MQLLRASRLNMEKLTSILAVASDIEDGRAENLEKAVLLARAFGARIDLLVMNSAQARTYTALCAANSYDEVLVHSVSDEHNEPEKVVLRMALGKRPDLVIKQAAGPRPLRRLTLGPNDWQLAQECPAPLLLTRGRPWASPPRFAAAVDVAEGEALARTILHTSGFLALGCHARIDVLYSEREEHDARLRMERAVRLAQIVREFHVGCERLQHLSGAPERTLPSLIAARGYDVLALGSRLQGTGMSALFGGVAARLVEACDGDVLFVGAPAHASASLQPQPSKRAVRMQAALSPGSAAHPS
jgi:nucleotide-binding universal stress UspA family protein